MIKENLVKMYAESFAANAELPALDDYFSGEKMSYMELATEIAKLHLLFEKVGIQPDDKIALIGRNNPRWVMTYVATITYGAVLVPVLQDFNPVDMTNIIDHSDSRLLFVTANILENLDMVACKKIEAAIDLDDFHCSYEREGSVVTDFQSARNDLFAERYPNGFTTADIKYPEVPNEKLAIISYTSGTTGYSKGVMLTINNLSANVKFALDHKFHVRGSRVLGLLPLAHAYGCAFDMLTPLAAGSEIHLLGKTPAPAVLIKAMKEVRPSLLCTVPLVMEKVVRKQVMPKLNKPVMKILTAIPGLNRVIYNKVRDTMLDSFGGCLSEVNMGGAAVAPDVEKLLKKVRFPFTVGYGMTECAPLISYTPWRQYKLTSCGKILPGMEVRIDSPDAQNIPGEICVRGENVMLGYYKNEEATNAVFDKEGWLHTGDVGIADPDGTIYIRGRSKTMILTANGQNIYPEEIEAKLNALTGVLESLVYEKGGRMTALVVADPDFVRTNKLSPADVKELMQANLAKLNTLVAPYEKVSEIKLCTEEFSKTPKRSIRRYLYPDAAKLAE